LKAGNLNAAILAYKEALRQNPNDAETWAELARIQTYSSAFLITNPEKKPACSRRSNRRIRPSSLPRRTAQSAPSAPSP
jgi:hypothetical protein